MGQCFQWKAIGHCSIRDSCCPSHDPASRNRCGHRQKGQSSSPAPKAQTRTDGKIHPKSSGSRGESPSGIKKNFSTNMFTSAKRVSVEEQRAQKYDRFLRGRQNAYMIYEHFRATGAYEAVQGLPDLFSLRLQNDDVQEFDVRWDRALLSATHMPSDVILEGLYKSKLEDSVQLQTVLAMYDQETVRNNGQISYLRLKTFGKLEIDQMMRTRNSRVRKEVVERGAVFKSQKGKKANVDRNVGDCFQWKAHKQCSKKDSCGCSHDRLVRWSETKRTIVFSRTKFEGQD